MLPILAQGLARREKVIVVAEEPPSELIRTGLGVGHASIGGDAPAAQLTFLTPEDIYVRFDRLEPKAAVGRIEAEVDRAAAEGYAGLRMAVDMAWLGRSRFGERLWELEARLDAMIRDRRLTLCCQYPRRRFDPLLLLDVLRTHPIAMTADEIFENYYYLSPDDTDAGDLPQATLDQWLAHLTNDKQTTQALRESEARYRTLVNTSPDAVTVADLEGRITDVSERTLLLHGYSRPEEMLGRNVLDFIVPEQHERAVEATKRTLKEGIIEGAEYLMLRADGTRFEGELNASVVRNAQGEPEAFIAAVRDITARKAAERRLLEYQDKLRALALEASSTEDRERRRLAGALHDGLGQILALSKIRLGALRERLVGDDLTSMADEVVTHLDQAIGQTRSLLYSLSPVALYELGFQAAVGALCEQMEGQHGLDIETAFSGDYGPNTLEDDMLIMLYKAVRELLVNVVKHAGARKAVVSCMSEADALRVTVEDDGAGFDAAAVGPGKGMAGGFGIFSLRERLGQVGGRLEIDAGRGKGAKVSIAVPLRRPDPHGEAKQI